MTKKHTHPIPNSICPEDRALLLAMAQVMSDLVIDSNNAFSGTDLDNLALAIDRFKTRFFPEDK